VFSLSSVILMSTVESSARTMLLLIMVWGAIGVRQNSKQEAINQFKQYLQNYRAIPVVLKISLENTSFALS